MVGNVDKRARIRTNGYAHLEWPLLHETALAQARRCLSGRLNCRLDAQDVAQEALCRLAQAEERGKAVANPPAWITRVATNLCHDIGRRKARIPGDPSQEKSIHMLATLLDHRLVSPYEGACVVEMRERAYELLACLPSPYFWIAHLQYLECWTRSEVCDWLQEWRPVSQDTCRRLLRRTHALLRALGEQEDPRSRFSGWFTKKNRWETPPPPAFLRHYQ